HAARDEVQHGGGVRMERTGLRQRSRTGVLSVEQHAAPRIVSALPVDVAGTGGGGQSIGTASAAGRVSMASLSARAASGAAWTYAAFATGRLLVFAGLA